MKALLLLTFLYCFSAEAQSLSFEHVLRIHNRAEFTDSLSQKDKDIYSPKSVKFSSDGKKFYVNSLEGGATVVYEYPTFKKIKVISHKFNASNSHLFFEESTVFNYPYYQDVEDVNQFLGKPVEFGMSHGGRYLWIPYYRRSFDPSAQSPSAVAILDTAVDEIVRVMPTGPLPKYVVASPNGKWMAVVHWGDNTVGFIDISSRDYRDFRYFSHVVVEKQVDQSNLLGTDRDHNCGNCLRGAVFTPDSSTLLIARMSQGAGIAGIDMNQFRYLGTLLNVANTPRHLVVTPDGKNLLISSNHSGVVTKAPLTEVLSFLKSANGRAIWQKSKWLEKDLGAGARTLDTTADGRYTFVALNESLEMVMLDTHTLESLARTSVDAYPVGLAVSPQGLTVIVTSQGESGRGGNTVNIFRVKTDPSQNQLKLSPRG